MKAHRAALALTKALEEDEDESPSVGDLQLGGQLSVL